jgi:hypothetical protein
MTLPPLARMGLRGKRAAMVVEPDLTARCGLGRIGTASCYHSSAFHRIREYVRRCFCF